MKKKLLVRALLGAPIGFAINCLTSLLISLGIGGGAYYPVTPELTAVCGSELRAAALQFCLSLLYGAVWAGASLLWEMETWSLLRQTCLHFSLVTLATLPVAYACRWIPQSAAGVILYFAIFLSVYTAFWFTQYFSIKKRLKQLNKTLPSHK